MSNPKLKKILDILQPDETSVDFKLFDQQVQGLKDQLKEKIQVKTLDDVNNQLEKFRRRIDVQPLLDTMGRIEQTFNSRSEDLVNQLESKTTELQDLVSSKEQSLSASSAQTADLLKQEIGNLETQLQINDASRTNDVSSLKKDIQTLRLLDDKINKTFNDLTLNLNTTNTSIGKNKGESDKGLKNVQDALEKLRKELMNRINNIGGGQAAPRIQIGGVTMSTRYADINWKAGAGTTITYADNNTTKNVDITITATGSGSGIVRSIVSISTPTTAAATAGTDYVYICSSALTLTMPTAVGNQNLYTIKNTSSGTITIVFNGVQTGDGQTTLLMPIQYTSIDLTSDGANWIIT